MLCNINVCFVCLFFIFDIVRIMCHLVIYMQSNKVHKMFLMSEFYAAFMLARHVSTSPVHHQERFLLAVFADLLCAVIESRFV